MDGLLGVTLAAQLILFIFTGVSFFSPDRRVWPPPSRHSWQFYATWFLSWVTLSGAFLLSLLGENSLGLPIWLRFGAGVPLLFLGGLFVAWGFRELSLHTSLGLGGSLIQSGPYRWSRNPQYVGTCAYLASLALISGSHQAAIACSMVALWFVASPFVEEPWLADEFGDGYIEYCRAVPRFLGFRRLRSAA